MNLSGPAGKSCKVPAGTSISRPALAPRVQENRGSTVRSSQQDSLCKPAPPTLPGTGQPELFTLGTDTRRKAWRCLPGRCRGGGPSRPVCSLFSTIPPSKMWIAPFTTARWQPRATGLPPPSGRLTSHKRNKAQDCSHTSRPPGISRGHSGHQGCI